MKYISSAHNPTIKHIRKLASTASYRTKQRQTVLEGVHLCDSYLQQPEASPVLYVVSESSADHGEVVAITQRIQPIGVESIIVPDTLFSAISQLDNGVGVLCVVPLPAPVDALLLSETALLLDDVQDPGNLGTMLRTAAAAGVKQAYLSAGCAKVWSPKVLRAGMGAQFVVTTYEEADLAAVIRGATIPVLATSLQAKKTLYEYDLNGHIAWLFGSEGRGVSPELQRLCGDNTLIIPQQSEVESLNVAAATAVCLFEQRRQIHAH